MNTPTPDDGEELEASPYEHYFWDCPACQGVNDAGEVEPGGDEVCEDCGITVTVKR